MTQIIKKPSDFNLAELKGSFNFDKDKVLDNISYKLNLLKIVLDIKANEDLVFEKGPKRAAIDNYINKKNFPGIDFLFVLRHLGISIDWFLFGEGEMFINSDKPGGIYDSK